MECGRLAHGILSCVVLVCVEMSLGGLKWAAYFVE
jgi:hypothetical protein